MEKENIPNKIIYTKIKNKMTTNLNIYKVSGLIPMHWWLYISSRYVMELTPRKSPFTYSFTLWPLALNVALSSCRSSTAPYGYTCTTVNGPDHIDFSFLTKSQSLELKKRTCVPVLCPSVRYSYHATPSSSPCKFWRSRMLGSGTHQVRWVREFDILLRLGNPSWASS